MNMVWLTLVGLVVVVMTGVALYLLLPSLFKRKTKTEKKTTDTQTTGTTQQTTEKKLETRTWFIVIHPFWTLVIVVLLWVALTNFATTMAFITGFFTKPVNGVLEAFGGAAPQRATTSAAVPEKSVGGPLLWRSDAQVKIRPALTVEESANGVAFVGMVPPKGWVDISISHNEDFGGGWNAYLISRLNELGFLPEHSLSTHGIEKDFKTGTVFHFNGLSGPEMLHERRYCNTTRESGGQKLNEMYLQTTGQGAAQKFVLERTEENGTFQYLCEVGAEEISFQLPTTKWKCAWVAPIHLPHYQSWFLRSPIPANGISIEAAERLVQMSDGEVQKRLSPLVVDGTEYRRDVQFQALVLEKNGEVQPLPESILIRPGDVEDGRITLSLNLPNNGYIAEVVRPLQCIVGIQL